MRRLVNAGMRALRAALLVLLDAAGWSLIPAVLCCCAETSDARLTLLVL
jgi:hypothetical protein